MKKLQQVVQTSVVSIFNKDELENGLLAKLSTGEKFIGLLISNNSKKSRKIKIWVKEYC